jgi:hypothetical protein
MTYFDGFGNYGNSTNQKLEVTDGNSATKKNGDSYSGQDGNSTSHSIGNLNSFRRGYSNTLVDGFNFSTTLGASFSTVVGANVPSTGGGKIEHINPFSLKWTQGLYDYDFKNCHTQVKVNEGKDIYTVNSPDLHEWKGLPFGKETKIVDKKQDFAKSADGWFGTKSDVVQSEIRKVLDGNVTYGTVTTTVSGEYCINSTGPITLYGLGVNMKATTIELEGSTSIKLMTGGTTTINGSIIKVG